MNHAHLAATDIRTTIAFWQRAFDAKVVFDAEFADARNVFLRVGTVHHIGIQTDELQTVVERLRGMGYSVTDIRREATVDYAMAEGPRQPADRDLSAPRPRYPPNCTNSSA